jgi:hypothetical protein
MKNNPLDQFADLYAWMYVQMWFMPYYIIGKQDEWKAWTNSSLNGWRASNLCKPN